MNSNAYKIKTVKSSTFFTLKRLKTNNVFYFENVLVKKNIENGDDYLFVTSTNIKIIDFKVPTISEYHREHLPMMYYQKFQ